MVSAKNAAKIFYLLLLSLWISTVHIFPQALPGGKAPVAATPPASVAKKESLVQKLFKKIGAGAKKAKGIKKPAFLDKDSVKYALQVYGWHPYELNTAQPDYNYNLLTTLSYYACNIVCTPPSVEIQFQQNDWNSPSTTQMIRMARADGCRIDLTITCSDAQLIGDILNYPSDQQYCIEQIVNLVTREQNADGVTIAFESLPSSNEVQFTQFMKALYDTLSVLGKTLSMTLPVPDSYNALDTYSAIQAGDLAAFVNQFILSPYSEKPKKNIQAPAPVFPLESGYKWNANDIKRSVGKYVSEGIPEKKLILVLPYYGTVWEVDSSNGTAKYKFKKHLPYHKIADHADAHAKRIQYDTLSQSSYYFYTEKGKSYVCFYDNPRSVRHKYEWAGKQGLAGVGIWALGYDSGRNDMWHALNKKVNVVKMDSSLTKPTGLSDSSAISQTTGGATTGNKGGTGTAAADTTQAKSAEDTLLSEVKSVAKHPQVLVTIILTLLVFGIAGIGFSLSYKVVRDAILITEPFTYGLIQLIALLTFAAFYFIIAFIEQADPGNIYINTYQCKIWLLTLFILGEIVIHILSYKMFSMPVRRGKLP